MTREEAIICKVYLEDLDKYHTCNEYKLLMQLIEQDPCEDAISRKAVLDVIDGKAWEFCDYLISKGRNDEQKPVSHFADNLRECVREELPSVTPQEPKTGHWFYDKSIENWRCSECKETPKTMGYCGSANFMAEHFKFCNHCGAKMVESQESEDMND